MDKNTRNIIGLLALGGAAFLLTRNRKDEDSDGGGGDPGPITGCTDPNALNYNSLAQDDDGS